MRLAFAAILVLVAWFSVLLPLSAQEAVDDLLTAYFDALEGKSEEALEHASNAVLRFGQGGQIDADGIVAMIAIRRASVRASAMRRLLVADINNDGWVTIHEAAEVVA
ncbi:hypothetical protein [Shimia abyssi]|uniref:Uncharacterized protein n=1 Tax=Shimia abyssi TaxID=1662395 RepID=A0A2P8FKZ2_9RHOB|nr:hypothetical protein [Shimia abyssi]PSL22372.1 hypothetical protein CLV88_101801 [Shimia abyssi]